MEHDTVRAVNHDGAIHPQKRIEANGGGSSTKVLTKHVMLMVGCFKLAPGPGTRVYFTQPQKIPATLSGQCCGTTDFALSCPTSWTMD